MLRLVASAALALSLTSAAFAKPSHVKAPHRTAQTAEEAEEAEFWNTELGRDLKRMHRKWDGTAEGLQRQRVEFDKKWGEKLRSGELDWENRKRTPAPGRGTAPPSLPAQSPAAPYRPVR